MKMMPYEDNALSALEDAMDEGKVCPFEWHWAYHLLKALVFALLYIGTSIRENKNV